MLIWPIDPRYRLYVQEEMRRVFREIEHDRALRPSGYPFVPADLYEEGAKDEATYIVDCSADFMIAMAAKK